MSVHQFLYELDALEFQQLGVSEKTQHLFDVMRIADVHPSDYGIGLRPVTIRPFLARPRKTRFLRAFDNSAALLLKAALHHSPSTFHHAAPTDSQMAMLTTL